MSDPVKLVEQRVDNAIVGTEQAAAPHFENDTVEQWKAGPKSSPTTITTFDLNIGNAIKLEAARTIVRAKALYTILSDNSMKVPLNVIYKAIQDVGQIAKFEPIIRPYRNDGFVRVGGTTVPFYGRYALKLENSLYLEGKLVNVTFALSGSDAYINKIKAVEANENLKNLPANNFVNLLISKGANLTDINNTMTVGLTSGDSSTEVPFNIFQNVASTLHSLIYFYSAGQLAALENVDDDVLPASFLMELYPNDVLDLNALANNLRGKGALKNTIHVAKMNDALKYMLWGVPFCIPYYFANSNFMNPTQNPPYGPAPSSYIYAPLSLMVCHALATNNGIKMFCDSTLSYAHISNTELRAFVADPANKTPMANAAAYRAKMQDLGTDFAVEALYRNEINYTVLKDSFEYTLIEPLL